MTKDENKITLFCGECGRRMLVEPGLDFDVHFCWSCLYEREERLKKQMIIKPIAVFAAAIFFLIILPWNFSGRMLIYGGIPALAFAFKPIFDYKSNKKEIENYEDADIKTFND